MPVYFLTDEIIFPDPENALEDGLLALGGDLSPARLVKAYQNGIFPWYGDGSPILWWSPDPRMVLFPDEFKISKSLKQSLKKNGFSVKTDTNFEAVISLCAKVPRSGQDGTWITEEMKEAYIEMHKLGYAHSFETYYDNKLVGGLYGISLGKGFFGESMFHLMRDASKIAMYYLVEYAKKNQFRFIDAQQETDHLRTLGARPVARKYFLKLLKETLEEKFVPGGWDGEW